MVQTSRHPDLSKLILTNFSRGFPSAHRFQALSAASVKFIEQSITCFREPKALVDGHDLRNRNEQPCERN